VPGRTRVLSPTATLRRRALVKGFLGGNKTWMAVGALVWTPVLMRKVFGRNVEILSTEILEPGQAVRIEAIRPPTKGERRATRRAR
jgi:hypothetical protein